MSIDTNKKVAVVHISNKALTDLSQEFQDWLKIEGNSLKVIRADLDWVENCWVMRILVVNHGR